MVGPPGAAVDELRPADRLRQAEDGAVGPATSLRHRAVDGGHPARARRRRLGTSRGPGDVGRRRCRRPVRGDLSGAHPGPDPLRSLGALPGRRRLPDRNTHRHARAVGQAPRSRVGQRGAVGSLLPERRERSGSTKALRPLPAAVGESRRRRGVRPGRSSRSTFPPFPRSARPPSSCTRPGT